MDEEVGQRENHRCIIFFLFSFNAEILTITDYENNNMDDSTTDNF